MALLGRGVRFLIINPPRSLVEKIEQLKFDELPQPMQLIASYEEAMLALAA